MEAETLITDIPSGLFALCILILAIAALSKRQTMQRRAEYNRKVGQLDLAAPLPSETHALQAAQRRSGSTIITLLVIILVLLFGLPFLLPLLLI
jgi:hypothetical protein